MANGISNALENTDFSSFSDVLTRVTATTPEKISIRYISSRSHEIALSYSELMHEIHSAAGHIKENCAVGERAVLLLPAGVDFVSWFVGCFFSGAVATPTAVPTQRREWERLANILQDSAPSLLITNTDTLEKLSAAGITEFLTQKQIKIIDVALCGRAAFEAPVQLTPDMLAFLQYTSGSTGNPKGVMVTHANLVHNEETIRGGIRSHKDSVFVSWLPLFHDMGLIGQMLQSLYMGGTLCLMSPETFLRDPLCWLEAISKYKGSVAGGPNFAYELCIKKAISSPERLSNLNLSSWSVAFNGAEPVRAETLERFAEVFSSVGFKKEFFYPCYGLAECTLMVTGPRQIELPQYIRLSSDHLQQARVMPSATDDAKLMVGSGASLGGHTVLIVDPDSGVPCAGDQVGEIWVKGGSVAVGYWNNPTATKESFHAFTTTGEGPFLRTGDLGFLHEENLFISSRCKDLIIINGKNFYPQDVERSAESANAVLRPGCSASFGVEKDGNEQLVILCEIDSKKVTEADYDGLMASIRAAIFSQQSVGIAQVALYSPQTLFKTSSGKIQRRQCKAAFLEGKIKALAHWVAPTINKVQAGNDTVTENIDSSENDYRFQLMQQRELLASLVKQFEDNIATIDSLLATKNAIAIQLSTNELSTDSIAPLVKPTTPQKRNDVPNRLAIKQWLRKYFIKQLGLPAHLVNDHSAFSDFGLDSAQALELCEAMSAWIGFDVPATQLWSCPNIEDLSQALLESAQWQEPSVTHHADARVV